MKFLRNFKKDVKKFEVSDLIQYRGEWCIRLYTEWMGKDEIDAFKSSFSVQGLTPLGEEIRVFPSGNTGYSEYYRVDSDVVVSVAYEYNTGAVADDVFVFDRHVCGITEVKDLSQYIDSLTSNPVVSYRSKMTILWEAKLLVETDHGILTIDHAQ